MFGVDARPSAWAPVTPKRSPTSRLANLVRAASYSLVVRSRAALQSGALASSRPGSRARTQWAAGSMCRTRNRRAWFTCCSSTRRRPCWWTAAGLTRFRLRRVAGGCSKTRFVLGLPPWSRRRRPRAWPRRSTCPRTIRARAGALDRAFVRRDRLDQSARSPIFRRRSGGVHARSTPALAKAGTDDVLAGMAGASLAQGLRVRRKRAGRVAACPRRPDCRGTDVGVRCCAGRCRGHSAGCRVARRIRRATVRKRSSDSDSAACECATMNRAMPLGRRNACEGAIHGYDEKA